MVDKKKCISCGSCLSVCPVDAITWDTDGKALISYEKCIKCLACERTCPVEAIKIKI